MKNIFDYAKKELSQDAFLMWLANNYQDKDIGDFAKSFLLTMIGKDSNSKITDLTTTPQHKDIRNVDVLIECKINDQQVAIALEDKTYTKHHDNQLEEIGEKMIEKFRGEKNQKEIYLIYFKTGYITKKEKLELREISFKLQIDWIVTDSEFVKQQFDKFYCKGKNAILDMYYEFIENLVNSYVINDNDVIDKSLEEWSDKGNKWSALFDQFDQSEYEIGVGYYKSYWYKYILINKDKDFFSVEIRSNVLNNNSKYSFKLVTYSMDEEKQTIENLKYFKNLCKNKPVRISNNTIKQVATIDKDGIKTVKDFKEAVEEVVSICEDIYKDFDKNRLNFKETKK